MLGAIIGDINGSTHEFGQNKTRCLEYMNPSSRMTDDSYLTMAVMKAFLPHLDHLFDVSRKKEIQVDLVKEFAKAFEEHPDAGFGAKFVEWASSPDHEPYGSYGNGAGMRISPVGWVSRNLKEVKYLSDLVTEITHNSEQAMRGAECIAGCVYLARHSYGKRRIEKYALSFYPRIADLDFHALKKDYKFDVTMDGSAPEAIFCFLRSYNYESALTNTTEIGGDVDTIGAMSGAIAEAFYADRELAEVEKQFLYWQIDPEYEAFLKKFYKAIGSQKFSI